ncbi:MAG: secretin N-terminal domain-containing protein [Planctomycetota bacterium]|nr:secretin N-terminal domain-containing protein [Planctomycetota bacterium]
MPSRISSRAVVIAALLAAAGAAASASAFQDSTAESAEPAAAPVSQPAVDSPTEPPNQPQPVADPKIRFQFKDTPFEMVLDFFARETGLPVIREAPAPKGTMTFVGGTAYTFDEALSILNMNLMLHGVSLRRENNFLYLATIKDSLRKPSRVVSVDDLPDDITPDMIVTMTIPLDNTRATQVAEQIKPLIGEYGGITPIDAQNMLILVESAAQCERIASLIRSIDSVRPVDSEFKVFKLSHSKAEDVVEALKGLVGQRMQQIFIDKDGNRTVAEEIDVAGLNIQPDPRTNSVIVVGSHNRIETVEQLIQVLDVPGGGFGGEQQMVTFVLETITPEQAARTLNSLFSSVPKESKPTIVPLSDVGKVTIIGAQALVLQATALVGEIDPSAGTGEPRDAQPETVVRALALEHITPAQAEQIVRRMLTVRQQRVVRYSAAPDGTGFLVSGPTADVATFEQLLKSLDRPATAKTEVRVVQIDSPDPQSIVDRALELDTLTDEGTEEPVSVTVDAESRRATIVGSSAAITRFERRLNEVEKRVIARSVSRSYQLTLARPSELAPRLTRLARPLLTPDDGTPYVVPTFEPLDELDTLIVRAEAEQFAVIEELIAQFDAEEPVRRDFRVIRVRSGDPAAIRERTLAMLDEMNKGLDEDNRVEVEVQVDAASGSLLVWAESRSMQQFNSVLQQVQQLVPPARSTRVLDVRNIEAAEILAPLQQLLASADSIDPARAIPEPTITVLDRTNSLVVTAEAAQHQLVTQMVQRLDRPNPADLPPMRLLQLRAADATNVARLLQERYDSRPLTDRTARPVKIKAEAQTNTLIVTAHEELFEDVKAQIDILNQEGQTEPERTTKLFPLKVAKAMDVASAMDKLYPEPPMPADRFGRPMPWLREKKDVNVSADPSSNSLIFDAPTDRIPDLEELAAQLDRVEVPPQAELRTFRVVKGDLNTITSTLSGLARQGALSSPAQPGKQAVKVMIEAEPKSSTLIVAGDAFTFEKVEEILLSLSAVPVERSLRIIPISNTPASTVRDRAMAIYDAQVAGLPESEPVEVTVDDNSNSLEVVGSLDGLARFSAIIDQLQRQTGSAREVRLIELKLAKVTDIISFLNEMVAANQAITMQGGPAPVFEPIEATNSLLVAAQPSQLVIIEQLVRSIDAQQAGERPPLRILRLRTTDASGLAVVLQRSYAGRPVEERTKKPVDIQADAATNTLIISAHPEVLPEIEEIVNQLNETQAMDAEGREIRIFPLSWARAEELAKTIDEMFPEPPMPYDSRGRPMPHLRQPKEVFVRADRATNSLIVDAPAQRLAGFEQIVQSLDQQNMGDDLEIRTYRIERADLAMVARTLEDLSSSGALRASSRTPVTINTEPATRTLVVSGPTEVFKHVEEVLDSLGQAPDRPETSMKMYPLKFARAEQLQVLLTDLLATRLRDEQERAGRASDAVETLLDVASHGPSNTLIITAPASIQQIAEELIKSLDTEAAAAGRRTIRVLPLTYADAAEVAKTLTQTVPKMDLTGGGDVTIISATGSNAIILAGASADLKRVEALIEPLDVRPDDPKEMGVETFKLVHADAARIAETVQSLLVEQQETDPRILAYQIRYSRNPNLFKKPSIHVEAEPRTNALIVSAPAATLELAKTIIERLDQPAELLDRKVATFTPSKADPRRLVTLVSKIVDETQPQERHGLELTAEAGTRSVVAIGSAAQIAEAMRLLAEFDDRAFSLPDVELTVVDLDHADATAVARMVEALASDRSRWPQALRDAEQAGIAVAAPRITADSETNRLVISAPGPLAPVIRELVATLDQPSGREVQVRLFALRQGSAESVAAALQVAFAAGVNPGEPRAVATAEPTSNTVIVSGTAERVAQAESLVRAMDETVEPNGMGVRTITLKYARAESLAPILEQLLKQESAIDQIPEWSRWQYLLRNPTSNEGVVRVAAETRLNAIVVAASLDVMQLAEQIVAELDVPPNGPSGGGRLVRVIPLLNADATVLAANIDAVFEEDASLETPPVVRVDPEGNALIVRATVAQMKIIGQLASDLDAATINSARQLRMIPVDRSRADAALMAATLQRLLEQQGGIKVEIISTDELLGGKSNTPKPSGEATPPRPFPGGLIPEVLTPRELVALSAIAISQPEPPRQPEAVAKDDDDLPVVRIAVDTASNTLVVIGSPRMTERIAALAAQLENQMPAEASAVRIVTLPQGADAAAIAQIVSQTIRQVGNASANNPGGFTSRVAVQADPSGSAVIVWANQTDFDSIGALIASVSSLGADVSLTVKNYQLANITADRAKQAIQDLFAGSPRGRQARRVRGLDLTVESANGDAFSAVIDPKDIRITATRGSASVLVAAPAEAMRLIDSLIGLLDQSPVSDRLAIRRYELANARATDLSRTLQTLFDAQRQGPLVNEMARARFVADDRTNSLLVTASADQHDEIQQLLASTDSEQADDGLELAIIRLDQANPQATQRILEQVIIGRDAGKRERVQISAERDSGVLVVRAEPEDIAEIRRIVAELDTAETAGLPVRSIKLEQADASEVARSLSAFFRDRQQAMRRAGLRTTRQGVAITGDRRSGTLIVAASDADFAQITDLVQQYDTESSAIAELKFEIIRLEHARVGDLEDTLRSLANELQYERMYGGRNRSQPSPQEDKLLLEFNERLNSVVVMGQGETMEVMKNIIAKLDVPFSEMTARVVKIVPISQGDPQTIARVVESAMDSGGSDDFWYWPPRSDPDKVTVEVDARSRAIILIGPGAKVEQAVAYAEQLDTVSGRPNAVVDSIPLQHAEARRAAQNLNTFFRQRARAEGSPPEAVSIIGSQDGNLLFVTADEDSLALVRTLVAELDVPEIGEDRQIEIVYLQNGTAGNVSQAVRSMFPPTGRADERVLVTPQPENDSLLVSAPPQRMASVLALVKELDASPRPEDVNIASVPLVNARAFDVADSLRAALPSSIKITITPVPRSNTLLLTGSDETIALVTEQISRLDIKPEIELQTFRRIKLEHVLASDVNLTLSTLLRDLPKGAGEPSPKVDYSPNENTISVLATPEQMSRIEQIIRELDVTSGADRHTEFVRMEFADAVQTANALKMFYGRFAQEAKTFAARNVSIVADEASNSLVISAADSEWESILALLEKLDTPDYDSSRQLVVIPLKHADAASVARALNEGFRQRLQDELSRERARQQQNQPRANSRDPRDGFFNPPVLVDAEGVPSVSAETQTNSLIVSAGRKELERIERIVEQLDVPEFVKLPQPVVIPIERGRASAIAAGISQMFATQSGSPAGPRSARIFGDDLSNTLIVRADEDDLIQIWSLVRELQSQNEQTIAPRLVRLETIPATRLRQLVQTAFAPVAQRLGEPFAVDVERTSNSLVITASPGLFEQVKTFVQQLDSPSDDGGNGDAQGNAQPDNDEAVAGSPLTPGMLIVPVSNNAPQAIRTMLEQMGVTRPVPDDRFGIVSEPVTLVEITSRAAIGVIGNDRDAAIVAALIRTLDAQRGEISQEMAVVPLKLANAGSIVSTLQEMLNPANQDVKTGPAQAVQEHIRRLRLTRGFGRAELSLDLTQPIRLIPVIESNAVIVGSTPGNVAAVADLIKSLDTLPVGDAIVVRIFPLENAAANRIKAIVDELFSQGETLRRLPGTKRQGLPPTATGQALAGEIAVSVDDRTNALLVAGREEAVALVEVLIRDLDADTVGNWVEPALIPLEHADARTIADIIDRVIIQGSRSTPEADGLQRQVARLRILVSGGDPTDASARIESDLFVPLSSLVVEAEPDTNTLIVVGTPKNIEVVRELIASLDVELTSAGNAVRFFPLEFAAADRVSAVLTDVFDQREAAGVLRPEDRLIASPDARTNTLIISTSARSFEIVETLLTSLDAEDSNFTVGLHVLPVPGADVVTLAGNLQRLMDERIESTRRSGGVDSPMDTFSVLADPANSLLILACSEENLQLVKDLVKTIQEGATIMSSGGRMELIELQHARAEEVADSIREVYVDRENERRGQNTVSVTAEARLNALIVRGSDADIDAILDLVDRFDKSEVLSVQDVRRFELTSANSLEVVRLLESVLAGQPLAGSVRQGRATRLRYLRQEVTDVFGNRIPGGVTEAEVDDFIREQVRLTADLRTNSVLVSAPTSIVDLIESILLDLDGSTAGSREIEAFRLVNADARAMAEVLRDLFNLRVQGDTLVLIPTGQRQGADEDPDGLNSTSVTAVPNERQELSITIDARTNTLLVSGTEEYLDLVRKVVLDLDVIEANEREQLVFHLTNAKAKDLEVTLQGYFDTEATTIQAALGGADGVAGSVSRQLEQEVTVVGDEKSNKLLISASPRYINAVEQIVMELDAAPPQVQIQVLIAEVTLDDENSWGADINVGGLTGLGPDAFQLGSFAAGGALSSALGTANLSVSSVDFELMVRALEVQGKLEVLSRPSVTVKNNEAARMQVGENIGVPGNTTQSGGGNVTTGVTYQDVGIILEVTPTIGADGFVQLEIMPEISALTSRTTQVSESVQAPIITRRSVQTTVSVMNGQTVVIGGLIQTTKENREWKVPIIGDIPLLGLPFRSMKEQNVKTELLVILTPHIIPGGKPAVERYRNLTDRAIGELSDPSRIIDRVGPVNANPVLAPTPKRVTPGSGADSAIDFQNAPRIRAKRATGEEGVEGSSADEIDWSAVTRIDAKRSDAAEDGQE